MPVLPCPLGEDGETWKTQNIPVEQAMELVASHVKYAHSLSPFSQNYQKIKNLGRGSFGKTWVVKLKDVVQVKSLR